MQRRRLHHEVVDAGRSVDAGWCLDVEESEGVEDARKKVCQWWGSDSAACYIGDEEGACLAFGQERRGGDCSASRAGRVALIDDR